jgi:hypothetical protein
VLLSLQAAHVAKFVPVERSAVNVASIDSVVDLVRPLVKKHFQEVLRFVSIQETEPFSVHAWSATCIINEEIYLATEVLGSSVVPLKMFLSCSCPVYRRLKRREMLVSRAGLGLAITDPYI